MKEDFEKRQDKRHNKVESLIEEYGSIDKIPLKIKEDLVKESMKDLPLINGIHIADLCMEMEKIQKELILIEIEWLLLSLAMLFKYIVK